MMENRLSEFAQDCQWQTSKASSLEEARCYFKAMDMGWCELGWSAEHSDLVICWSEEGERLMLELWEKKNGKD